MTENSENINLESVNEDTVNCFFFLSSPNSEVIFWEDLCKRINNTIKLLSENYLWHRDEFTVYLPIDSRETAGVPTHLASTTCFGDNIEDEWFITYLVLQISNLYPDVIAQIKDNDGDYLLIEAADCLPSWANPDNTDNRVFIYNNQIHIISPDLVNLDSKLNLEDAIKYVADANIRTESLKIQEAILKRIGNYPDKIKENIHRTFIKLPLDLATLLTLKPSLISPIVGTYCNHDMIDAKSCKNIKLKDCTIITEVKFTKCLYAMLIISKLMKTLQYAKLKEDNKKNILGLKLTCGYEMIMSKSTKDIFSTKEYNRFIRSLSENGYFKDNIKGSQNYKKLLQEANDFFLKIECPMRSNVCSNITQLMCTNEFKELKDILSSRHVSESELIDDNEDWLNINSEQLNDLLNTRYGKQSRLKNDDVITPRTITSELSNFLKETSDFEGIEPNDMDENLDNNIEFDSIEFVDCLKNMLNLISLEDSNTNVSESDDDLMENEKDDLDRELECELNITENDEAQGDKILLNIKQSMKEEQGSSGPSSNILRTIGINKIDLLDSDDD